MIIDDQLFYTIIGSTIAFSVLGGMFIGAFDMVSFLRRRKVIKPKRFSVWSKGTYTFTPEEKQ